MLMQLPLVLAHVDAIPPALAHVDAVPPAAVCRIWDMRTKVQVFALTGHEDTVGSIIMQPTDPQARRAFVFACC
jgi:hypothetical protein